MIQMNSQNRKIHRPRERTQQIFIDFDCTSYRFKCFVYSCKQNKAFIFTEFIFLIGGEGDRPNRRDASWLGELSYLGEKLKWIRE